MRIKEISVTNLFGTFNHVIPLNLSEHVTIIIGPNGYGKTMMLKMLHSLFSGSFSIFFKIPFDEFKVTLENKGYIEIYKTKTNSKKKQVSSSHEVKLVVSENGSTFKEANLAELNEANSREMLYFARSFLDEDTTDRQLLNQLRHGYDFTNPNLIYSLLEKYWDITEKEMPNVPHSASEMWRFLGEKFGPVFAELKKLTQNLDIHLIQAQRLTSRQKVSGDKKVDTEMSVVNLYSDELTRTISEKLAQSTERAQKLDSTFPHRVISQQPSTTAIETYENLRDELQKLREKRIHLKETGILVDLGVELEIPESIQGQERLNFLNGVLAEYIKDTQEKLAIFDELSDKIELLKRIINDRFMPHKQLQINKDKGFLFRTSTGHELTPSDLSSGEQHELVLLYELLFKVPAGSLVLIDEPELSLHIAWQQQFLEDVIAITEIAKLDVLIATHAPDIIHHHWSLTVDLGKVKTR